MRLLIDAHLDLAWNALSWKRNLRLPLEAMNRYDANVDGRLGRGRATVSFPEMRQGGVAVCFATLMARVPRSQVMVHAEMLDYPAPEIAFAVTQGQLAYYKMLQRMEEVQLIKTREQLDAHWQRWVEADEQARLKLPIGIVLAMEGCDAIVDPDQADYWYDAGLRCPALVHYGTSAYAVGTGEEGPLSPAGKTLLKQFERLGMLLDLTHLSDQSFWEVSREYSGPVFASHQNCRALVPKQRQFTDEQIRWIIERDGVLGAACDAWMLDPEWVRGRTTDETTDNHHITIARIADHIDHVCQLAGNCRHAAIGSDLDGGFGNEQTPADLKSIADLQKLSEILAGRGYQASDLDAIFHGNWLRLLRNCLP